MYNKTKQNKTLSREYLELGKVSKIRKGIMYSTTEKAINRGSNLLIDVDCYTHLLRLSEFHIIKSRFISM